MKQEDKYKAPNGLNDIGARHSQQAMRKNLIESSPIMLKTGGCEAYDSFAELTFKVYHTSLAFKSKQILLGPNPW